VQGLLADAEALADLGDAQALGQVGLGLAQRVRSRADVAECAGPG
jgi:hypothetical protein